VEELTNDNIKKSTEELRTMATVLSNFSDELTKAGVMVREYSGAMTMLAFERDILYKLILSIMLDYEIVEFKLTTDIINSLEGYDISIKLDEQNETMLFRPIVPKERENTDAD